MFGFMPEMQQNPIPHKSTDKLSSIDGFLRMVRWASAVVPSKIILYNEMDF